MKIFGYEFIVRKEKKKKVTGFSSKPWTESETNTMLRLISEGKSQKEIAIMLKRTVPAIYSRLNKVRKNG